ncbi:MAG: peptide chain release factor N(5)-glutamine methyltransferase [Dokdonella sp.]
MIGVRQLVDAAVAHIGGDSARAEAELLLAHVLQCSRSWLFAWPQFEPDDQQRDAFERLVSARSEGQPIAYLLGRRGFWSLDLEVSPAVLIPRPETELLVELALALIPLDAICSIADLGTGSGAIALVLAHERPRASVMATDASIEALDVARSNSVRLRIPNVAFAQGHWCAALGDARFDLIVSNPPYIANGDHHLDQGDVRHEPRMALTSGDDGLDAIRCIVRDTPVHLRDGAWLLLEHGWQQGAAVRELLRGAGFADVMSHNDLEGRERVSAGRVACQKNPAQARDKFSL